jgi:hypothetical protein
MHAIPAGNALHARQLQIARLVLPRCHAQQHAVQHLQFGGQAHARRQAQRPWCQHRLCHLRVKAAVGAPGGWEEIGLSGLPTCTHIAGRGSKLGKERGCAHGPMSIHDTTCRPSVSPWGAGRATPHTASCASREPLTKVGPFVSSTQSTAPPVSPDEGVVADTAQLHERVVHADAQAFNRSRAADTCARLAAAARKVARDQAVQCLGGTRKRAKGGETEERGP